MLPSYATPSRERSAVSSWKPVALGGDGGELHFPGDPVVAEVAEEGLGVVGRRRAQCPRPVVVPGRHALGAVDERGGGEAVEVRAAHYPAVGRAVLAAGHRDDRELGSPAVLLGRTLRQRRRGAAEDPAQRGAQGE